VEPCIKAGTSDRGCCVNCGAPIKRVVKKTPNNEGYPSGPGGRKRSDPRGNNASTKTTLADVARYDSETIDWQRTCHCENFAVAPCVVLDPFGGSGTVSLVADLLGRDSIYIDLNPTYALMAKDRVFTKGSWNVEYEKVGWE
jgi:hypothetical protein